MFPVDDWQRWRAAYDRIVAGDLSPVELLARLCALGFTPDDVRAILGEIKMRSMDGWSQRDREEQRDAILQRYRDGDLTAIQARAEIASLGYNATQISEFLRDAMKLVVGDILAASAKRRAGHTPGEGF